MKIRKNILSYCKCFLELFTNTCKDLLIKTISRYFFLFSKCCGSSIYRCFCYEQNSLGDFMMSSSLLDLSLQGLTL